MCIRDSVDILKKITVLHDRHRDAHDIRLLERIRSDDATRYLTSDDDHRNAIHIGCCDTRDSIRTVSYTHLDVYKRQTLTWRGEGLRFEELDAYATCTK